MERKRALVWTNPCIINKHSSSPHLSLWGFGLMRVLGGGAAVVPPGQRGAEPLHFTQVDEEGAVRAINAIEGVARIGCPACTHPLKDGQRSHSLGAPSLNQQAFITNRQIDMDR